MDAGIRQGSGRSWNEQRGATQSPEISQNGGKLNVSYSLRC